MFWLMFCILLIIDVGITTHFSKEINSVKKAITTTAKEVGTLNKSVKELQKNNTTNNSVKAESAPATPATATENTIVKTPENSPKPQQKQTEHDKKIEAAKKLKIPLWKQDLVRNTHTNKSHAELAERNGIREKDIAEILKISKTQLGKYDM